MDVLIKVAGRTFGKKGNMGIGVVGYDRHRLLLHDSQRISDKTKNTDVATCLAVNLALNWIERKKYKKVTLAIDNYRVFNSLVGYVDRAITEYIERIKKKIKQLEIDVQYQLVTVKKNKLADALALKAIGKPVALVHGDGRIEYWKSTNIPLSVVGAPSVERNIKAKIQVLNQRKNFNYNDCASLTLEKVDQYSNFKQKKLKEIIVLRYGQEKASFIESVLETANEGYKVSSYRWIARGLNPNAAFKRASIEMEQFGLSAKK